MPTPALDLTTLFKVICEVCIQPNNRRGATTLPRMLLGCAKKWLSICYARLYRQSLAASRRVGSLHRLLTMFLTVTTRVCYSLEVKDGPDPSTLANGQAGQQPFWWLPNQEPFEIHGLSLVCAMNGMNGRGMLEGVPRRGGAI